MPKAKHQDAIARQWEILKYLPRKGPGKTTKEIFNYLKGEAFSIAERSIQRDLSELSRLFSLVCNEDNKPYKWYWQPGKGEELPALTLTDALSLNIVESIVKPLIPHAMLETLEHRFNETNNKLAAMSEQNKNASWLNKVRNVQPALPLLPPNINESVLEDVQAALLNDKQVEVEYQSMDSDCAKTRLLSPLALVQRGSVTYLVAIMDGYADVRYYAVHRIQSAKQTCGDVKIPKGFSIDEEIKKGKFGFGAANSIKLHAYIDDWLCRILEETPFSEDQKITYEEEFPYLTATVEDTWQLSWWLLSQGDGIEVIKPIKLRNKMKKELRKALSQYID